MSFIYVFAGKGRYKNFPENNFYVFFCRKPEQFSDFFVFIRKASKSQSEIMHHLFQKKQDVYHFTSDILHATCSSACYSPKKVNHRSFFLVEPIGDSLSHSRLVFFVSEPKRSSVRSLSERSESVMMCCGKLSERSDGIKFLLFSYN